MSQNDKPATGEHHEIDWSSAVVPDSARWVHYGCGECGRVVTVSPRGARVSGLYCDCEDHGEPLWKFAVEFPNGEVVRKEGWEEYEVNLSDA